MGAPLAYPETRFQPEPPADLSLRTTRDRLSPAALRAFFRLVDRWNVRDEDARELLGGVSNGTYYAMKKDPNRTLSADQLVRISYLLGIFSALQSIHSPQLADRWILLPNTNRLFGGRAPLSFLLAGGTPALHQLRQLLEARRSGV